jgi:sterol desaturase/sphingolipid hydroxylase (fatty acid hydroxylase superfamily)
MSDLVAKPEPRKLGALQLSQGALEYVIFPIVLTAFIVVVLSKNKPAATLFGIGVVLLLAIEAVRFFILKRNGSKPLADDTLLDATTSFSVELIGQVGNLLVTVPLIYLVYGWLSEHTPLQLGTRVNTLAGDYAVPVTLVVCVFAADFLYYWGHRSAHRVELFWGSHSVHHSSEHFNPSTATRISFLDELWDLIVLLPMVLLGFDPKYVLGAYGIVLLYQLPLHQTWMSTLGPIEKVFNTPNHHRVHHAMQKAYIDKNFGGILIVWDRMFGSFADTTMLPQYGLTVPIGTYNPFKVMFTELSHLGSKMRHARSPKEAMQYAFKPPYWQPEDLKAAGA